MGLDNGFYIRSDARQLTREMLPPGIQYPFQIDYDDDIEIIYWRKNWGLRDAIFCRFGNLPNEYITRFDTPEVVLELIDEITSWIDKDKWEEEGRSIWTFEQVLPILLRDLINLSIVYVLMLIAPDIYLEFYDSY